MAIQGWSGPETSMQIYYKNLIMALLITFRSIWLPNLVEAGFCLSQLQEIGKGERENKSVKVTSVMFHPGWKREGIEPEAFIPLS